MYGLRRSIICCDAFKFRSLELLLDNESERLQALRVIRKSCAICPQQFPNAFTHSLSAIAMCSHGPSKDQLHRACVATLCELCKYFKSIINTCLVPCLHLFVST